jgi:hypothetical protein
LDERRRSQAKCCRSYRSGGADLDSEDIMNRLYGNTFRGLPLTPAQVREVEHYIRERERSGVPWDTPDLAAMLEDMLNPPERVEDEAVALQDSIAAERTVAGNEESDELDLLKCERDRNH